MNGEREQRLGVEKNLRGPESVHAAGRESGQHALQRVAVSLDRRPPPFKGGGIVSEVGGAGIKSG